MNFIRQHATRQALATARKVVPADLIALQTVGCLLADRATDLLLRAESDRLALSEAAERSYCARFVSPGLTLAQRRNAA